ncbi:acetyltransferase [uncultured Dokdonia sp.]|uniref:acetyltransferase n=1 Tax=uncultured Dokdonia sp. TaxID=575653 RepID=UPI002639C27E|nr:acetyltransferase [uncultured Dokdonia sp.]
MKRKIAFVGFGALGLQLFEFLNEESDINEDALFFDDIKFENKDERSFPFKDFLNETFKEYEFCVALGYKNLNVKRDIILQLKKANRKLVTFIHPSAFVHPTAEIEEGVIVYPMCNIDQNVIIHSGVLLNNTVTISHDSTIGMATFIAPGAIINGNIKIGSGTFIGSGSLISNSVGIGANVIVGIGTVVTYEIPDDSSVVGNPMRFLKKKMNLL